PVNQNSSVHNVLSDGVLFHPWLLTFWAKRPRLAMPFVSRKGAKRVISFLGVLCVLSEAGVSSVFLSHAKTQRRKEMGLLNERISVSDFFPWRSLRLERSGREFLFFCLTPRREDAKRWDC